MISDFCNEMEIAFMNNWLVYQNKKIYDMPKTIKSPKIVSKVYWGFYLVSFEDLKNFSASLFALF